MTLYSGRDEANARDLAERLGYLLRDLTDKWTEARVRFVERQRSQLKKIEGLQIVDCTMMYRLRELDRVLMIIWQLMDRTEPAKL